MTIMKENSTTKSGLVSLRGKFSLCKKVLTALVAVAATCLMVAVFGENIFGEDVAAFAMGFATSYTSMTAGVLLASLMPMWRVVQNIEGDVANEGRSDASQ